MTAPVLSHAPHCELLITFISEEFDSVRKCIIKFLNRLGEELCAALYAVCKDYSGSELNFIFWALTEDLSRLPFFTTEVISENALARTYQMTQTAAHVAPAAVAFKIIGGDTVRANTRDNGYGVREILRAAGEVINMSQADSMVVEMPDMKRHKLDAVIGAVIALTLSDPNHRSGELVNYLGANWRRLAPYADALASINDLSLSAVQHIVEGGPLSLTEGAL